MMSDRYSSSTKDRGNILPMVLVVVVVLGVVIAATATYAASTLRYGQVVESRSDRLSAAQAATNDAIEQLELQRAFSLCATSGGTGTGVSHAFPEEINGSDVLVNCKLINGTLPASDGFAIVITGVGMGEGTPTLDLDNGGSPKITGPVYSHDISRISLAKETTIVEGDVLYPNSACAIPDPSKYVPGSTAFQRSYVSVNNLTFDPDVLRGFYCVNKNWDELFKEPAEDPLLASLSAPVSGYDPVENASGCKVFSPGLYTTKPTLGKNNYFKSGVYKFANLGLLELKDKEIMTFGNRGVPGFPAVSNTPCDYVRGLDNADGATLYISGDTHFLMKSNPSGIDISARLINGRPIALHVLNTALDPNSTGLLATNDGNGRDAAFHGGFWAPNNSLLFLTIPSKKAAVLRGGAVIAAMRGKVSAAGTDGFLIEVPTTPGVGNLMLDAVATNPDGSTTVRTIIDYRASSGEIAIISRRVIW